MLCALLGEGKGLSDRKYARTAGIRYTAAELRDNA
jgi:hypothetical protein